MTEPKPRKVPKIVFDRPPLRPWRTLLITAIGLVVFGLYGGLMWWMAGRNPSPDFPDVYRMVPRDPYACAALLVGGLLGIAFGIGWGRSMSARIEMVDAPVVASRRRSRGTALQRVENPTSSRRW